MNAFIELHMATNGKAICVPVSQIILFCETTTTTEIYIDANITANGNKEIRVNETYGQVKEMITHVSTVVERH
jgi:hypothetical protein